MGKVIATWVGRMAFVGWALMWGGVCVCAPVGRVSAPAETGTNAVELAESGDIRRDATVQAVERVMPAVVNISTRVRTFRGGNASEDWIEEFFGYRRRRESEEYSRGSGVVIDPEGYVLTNVHVVQDVDDIQVQFADTLESLPAERVALSESKDIALLRIKAPAGRVFKSVRIAREDDLLLGETVIALGNPFGLGGSVSRGILSSKSRRKPESVPDGTPLQIADWLQTDAAINPGNSGGPLVNLRGELIGLNVAILPAHTGAQGIGFAVPIKRVNEALAETLSGDSIGGLWFGARLQPGQRPLVVRSIQSGSPAATAGLKPGDAVTRVDGRAPGSMIEFNRALVEAGAGREVRLQVLRKGQEHGLTLRLVDEKRYFDAALVRRRLGVTVQRVEAGWVVKAVDPEGPAARRLAPGMVIEGVDGQPCGDLVSLAKILNAKASGATVDLAVGAYRQVGPFVRREEGMVRLAVR